MAPCCAFHTISRKVLAPNDQPSRIGEEGWDAPENRRRCDGVPQRRPGARGTGKRGKRGKREKERERKIRGDVACRGDGRGGKNSPV